MGAKKVPNSCRFFCNVYRSFLQFSWNWPPLALSLSNFTLLWTSPHVVYCKTHLMLYILKGLDHVGHNCSSSEIWFSPAQGFNCQIHSKSSWWVSKAACWSIWVQLLPSFSMQREEWWPPGASKQRYQTFFVKDLFCSLRRFWHNHGLWDV